MPKKKPRTETVPNTLAECMAYFADPDVALMFVVTMRWPDGVVACPECGSEAVRFIPRRRGWQCGSHHLRRTFSVKTGTVMEDSPIPLSKWLAAIWLLVNCKNGISSYEVARDLDLTQKSAWFLLHRARLILQEGTLLRIGGGGRPVEVDETFIGGKARSMNAKQRARAAKDGVGDSGPYKYSGKALVMGMLERGGKVIAQVVKDRSRSTLLPLIAQHVNPLTTIMTDEHHSYQGLTGPRYVHEVIDHTAAYVTARSTRTHRELLGLLNAASKAPTSASSRSTCSVTSMSRCTASTRGTTPISGASWKRCAASPASGSCTRT